MEPNEQNMAALAHYLTDTINPDAATRKQAEADLTALHSEQGYPLLLLHFLQQDVTDVLKQQAAINFKNFVLLRWHLGTDSEGIDGNDRSLIKQHIVDLMLGSGSRLVQKQLSTALATISEYDFPEHWESLMPELISRLETEDYEQINGVLRTIHAVVRKFRYEFSKDIEDAVVFTIPKLAEPLLGLFKVTMEHLKSQDSLTALMPLLRCVEYVLKIFYSLSYVTLAQVIEDHLDDWMTEFQYLLQWTPEIAELYENEHNEDKPGILLKVQALVANAVTLYIHKYEEEFEPYLKPFVSDIWHLLSRNKGSVREDKLAIASMSFLQMVSVSPYHELFNDSDTLDSICKNVVIPNITLREEDCFMFEEDSEEYIKRDIEGSDSDTRRRSACELVKGLRKHYEENVSAIFTEDINLLLQQAESEEDGWRHKDAAIYLVTALSVTTKTKQHGASRTNEFVDVLEFYGAAVLPELRRGAENETDAPGNLILQADALRFSSVFRQTLPTEAYSELVPLFVAMLRSRCVVVHTYAAAAIENFLKVKDRTDTGTSVFRFKTEELSALLQPIVTNIIALLPGGEYKLRENTYVIRALMRVISTAKVGILSMCGPLMNCLVGVLVIVAQNPLNATFNHYMFEAIAALLKVALTANPSTATSFEEMLFPCFQSILANDVSEFSPYVFQLMSQLLECSPNGVSGAYQELLPPLMTVTLWERNGNVPPLVRLLQCYARIGPNHLLEHLTPTLGIFQLLISKRSTEHEAFLLLEALIEHMPPEATSPHLKTIFQLIFHRLKNSSTKVLVKSFVIFLGLFFGKHDTTAVVQAIDSVDDNVFASVLEKIWLPNVMKVSGNIERKIVAIGSINLLTKCEPMLSDSYIQYWPQVLTHLIGVFELDEQPDDPEDDDFDEFSQVNGGVTFNALHFASREENDPFSDVTEDLRGVLAASLSELSQRQSLVELLVQMEDKCQEAVQAYCQEAGVAIQ